MMMARHPISVHRVGLMIWERPVERLSGSGTSFFGPIGLLEWRYL
jgi:hypothetical protein